MNMYLSELQNKEIISMISGQNLGHVVDIEIDNKGVVVSFIVENRKIFHRGLSGGEIVFKYSDIEKIGKDVILVRV